MIFLHKSFINQFIGQRWLITVVFLTYKKIQFAFFPSAISIEDYINKWFSLIYFSYIWFYFFPNIPSVLVVHQSKLNWMNSWKNLLFLSTGEYFIFINPCILPLGFSIFGVILVNLIWYMIQFCFLLSSFMIYYFFLFWVVLCAEDNSFHPRINSIYSSVWFKVLCLLRVYDLTFHRACRIVFI